MSIRTAYYLMRRSGVNYKVSGIDLINRDTLVLNAGDVFLVERSGTSYKFTVSFDGGGDVDTSSIQDDDLFVCFIDGSEKKINGLEFSALVSPNVWETKDSWTHVTTDVTQEWQSVYGYDHEGVYRLDGTLIAAAASSTDLTSESEFVITGNSSTVDAGGVDIAVAWLSNIGTRTDLFSMFSGLALTSFDGYWDMTNVTNMAQMFYNVGEFTLDASGWNTSNVTNMSGMFYRQGMGGDLFLVTGFSSWNTTNVTNMREMFEGCEHNQDISGWDVSNVTDMAYMLSYNAIFNQDISGWNTSKVENMYQMFSVNLIFDQDISGWDVANVTNMGWMFFRTDEFNQPIGGWDTSNVTNMERMFDNAKAFNQPISSWDTSNVTDMEQMFGGAIAFNGDISGWNTTNVINMVQMFRNAYVFNQNIGGWNTSNVTNMRQMFENANVFNQDIGGWDTSNVTNMQYMFDNATVFNQDLSGWCVSNFGSKPTRFDQASGFAGQTALQPQWGTCP
jgi:surface protein